MKSMKQVLNDTGQPQFDILVVILILFYSTAVQTDCAQSIPKGTTCSQQKYSNTFLGKANGTSYQKLTNKGDTPYYTMLELK